MRALVIGCGIGAMTGFDRVGVVDEVRAVGFPVVSVQQLEGSPQPTLRELLNLVHPALTGG